MESNLVQQISDELRKRSCKTIRSVFWNWNVGNLSIFYKDGKVINYPRQGVLDPDLTVEQICDAIQ
jgi:hypothetical protein